MEQGNPFENLDQETQAKIQEAQMMEQGFQQIMQQKQMFNMELTETDFALTELDKADGDVFKIVGGQIVIKSTKDTLTSELTEKKELMTKRLADIDTQEKEFSEKMDTLRQEIMSKISPQEAPAEAQEEPAKEE